MGVGLGIFLMAFGAILAFALHVSVKGIDFAVVGIILMLAGAAGIALELAVFAPRRRRVITRSETTDPGGPGVVQRTITDEDSY